MIMGNEPNFKKSFEEAKKVLEENWIFSPPVPIVDIANNYGLMVEEEDLTAALASGKLYFNEQRIIVNKNDSKGRKRFTIAHELGHFLMHSDSKELKEFKDKGFIERSSPILAKEKKWYEKEADYFAAHVLVPVDFLKDFKDFKDGNTILSLAEKFNVSPTMMYFQMKNYDRGSTK